MNKKFFSVFSCLHTDMNKYIFPVTENFRKISWKFSETYSGKATSLIGLLHSVLPGMLYSQSTNTQTGISKVFKLWATFMTRAHSFSAEKFDKFRSEFGKFRCLPRQGR